MAHRRFKLPPQLPPQWQGLGETQMALPLAPVQRKRRKAKKCLKFAKTKAKRPGKAIAVCRLTRNGKLIRATCRQVRPRRKKKG